MIINEQAVVNDYLALKSVGEIAEAYGTYENRIRRILIKAGVKLRSKSEAQKLCLSKGRKEHPTAGKNMSDETKSKIGQKVSKTLRKISKQRSESAKKAWRKFSAEQRAEINKKRNSGIRATAIRGSKIEHIVVAALRERGYNVSFHKKHALSNEQLEIDIYLPELGVAIEVDGPSHYLPIWGKDANERETRLLKTQQADAQKNGLLMSAGVKVIRARTPDITTISQVIKDQVKANIYKALDTVLETNQPLLEVQL